MPGSSLWLLPPSDHPIDAVLTALIQQTSLHFQSPHSFLPHVTLTSEISPSTYSIDPQAWLESLQLPPGSDVQVKFEKLASEDVFVRKLYIKCQKLNGLKKLAIACRGELEGFKEERKVVEWAEEKYAPHLSLL
jgi:2',3'-cyclic-nucleotide 3'-phosphodiesterase